MNNEFVWPDPNQKIETLYFDVDNSKMYLSSADAMASVGAYTNNDIRTKCWFSPDKTQLLYAYSRDHTPSYCEAVIKTHMIA